MRVVVVVTTMLLLTACGGPEGITPVLVPVDPVATLYAPPAQCHAPYGVYHMSIDLFSETGCEGVWATHTDVNRVFSDRDSYLSCGWEDVSSVVRNYTDCVLTEDRHIYASREGFGGYIISVIECRKSLHYEQPLPTWCKAVYLITTTYKD